MHLRSAAVRLDPTFVIAALTSRKKVQHTNSLDRCDQSHILELRYYKPPQVGTIMASSWQLLDLEEENQLHKSRLFSIEEKPFKRITKRLAAINNLANSKVRQALTPPPENSTTTSNGDHPQENGEDKTDFAQLKEDITFDFAAFDYTIGRLQFLQSANAEQRDKYSSERVAILETCARVKENTAQLRVQLAEAQATRAQRTQWDALAKKIIDNKALQERPKAVASLEKLEEECKQLEAERETYAVTWRERKEQFNRIMDESMRLRRLIRDEKEEVERREGMDEDASGDGDGGADGQTPRPGSASGNATPRPDGAGVASAVPKGLGDIGDSTPRPMSLGGRTPMRDSPAPSAHDGALKPKPEVSGSLSQAGSRSGSREPSPTISTQHEEGEDVEMGELSREEGTISNPQITVEGQNAEDKMDTS
ncbi:THO complex subunit mft1 [Cytospora mali]|uniref:THO complex subunit mft1 n=1 Tax=Cytospora mali TaxID=578113 RepID=A0A194VNS4_CYTMA|nr:THO complex subunit mft1 [Valsa mali]